MRDMSESPIKTPKRRRVMALKDDDESESKFKK